MSRRSILAAVLVALVTASDAMAEPPTISYADLPQGVRADVQTTRTSCKAEGDEGTYDDMQGITPISFEDGSRGLIVDNEHVCNGWIKAGNCSNRGCDLAIWQQSNGQWRKIFNQHAYRDFISLDDTSTLKLIAISIGASSPECHPIAGKHYVSSQSCDALVYFRKGRWLWKIFRLRGRLLRSDHTSLERKSCN